MSDPNRFKSILIQVLKPTMTHSIAKSILEVKPNEKIVSRLKELEVRAKEGSLAEGERDEYDAYLDASDIVATLQAVASDIVQGGEC